jgi:hypothetical protein
MFVYLKSEEIYIPAQYMGIWILEKGCFTLGNTFFLQDAEAVVSR